jgi:hypothetical protein
MSVTFLPETCAACAISFFTRLRFASILITTSNQSILAWQIQPDDPAVRSLPSFSCSRRERDRSKTISRNSGISNCAVSFGPSRRWPFITVSSEFFSLAGPMNHGLRLQWQHLSGQRRPSIGYIPPATVRDIVGRRASNKNSRFGPGSKPDIQLGYRYQRAACLAELFAHGSTESRPTTSQSRQFSVGRRSAEPCLAPKTEQNLLELYNGCCFA